ncbi:MAG: DUF3016 domain-containing protein [Rubrivivax sp.]
MRKSLVTFAATCGLAALAAVPPSVAHAAGSVEVSYIKPQQFADAGLGQFDRDRNLETLEQVFRKLAAKLPDGQTLKLQITDVDLAGNLEFRGARPDLRVVRGGADWPQIDLTYSVLQDGRVLKSGQAHLSDPAYTFGLRSIRSDERMYFERRMVDDWFTKTFKEQ